MKQLNISQLIDIYYDIYETFNNEEVFIHAIYSIMARNNRRTGKLIIRKDFNNLNLKRYTSVLVELAGYPKFKIEEFEKDFEKDITQIINRIDSFDIGDIDNRELCKLIEVCKRLLHD